MPVRAKSSTGRTRGVVGVGIMGTERNVTEGDLEVPTVRRHRPAETLSEGESRRVSGFARSKSGS